MADVQARMVPKKAVKVDIRGVNVTVSTDYNDLSNKPSVNGFTLQGEMSLDDLGINNLATLEYEEVTLS